MLEGSRHLLLAFVDVSVLYSRVCNRATESIMSPILEKVVNFQLLALFLVFCQTVFWCSHLQLHKDHI